MTAWCPSFDCKLCYPDNWPYPQPRPHRPEVLAELSEETSKHL